ncbi:MAG: diguanylate cyclase [Nitrosomonadales bacterium]|nr:diguanylate cyclase [Nitrosomonadales bacterium]
MKVLVVEDSKVTIKVLGNYLRRMGIREPLIAESGADALEIYRRERPDLILLDAQLPDIDGFDVAQQIRAMEEHRDWTAIIFLTSKSKDEDLARGIEVGGDDYLMKPVSEVVLQAKVGAMQRLVEMQRKLVRVTHELDDANRELQRLSTTDGLTGIANRRMYDDLAQREWRRCERMKKPISLVLVDVDSFKLFNDNYGHQAGDECLKFVACQVAKIAQRPTDLAARYGGEEFVLVLGETDAHGANWLANRLRQQVAELNIPHYAAKFQHVTVSCGVASAMPDGSRSLNVLLKSADRALYRAKAAGRDQVVVCEYGKE